MLAFWQTMISFTAVVLLCVFCVRRLNVISGASPVIVVSATMIYFTICGTLGFLQISAFLYFALALAAGIYLLITCKKKTAQKVLTPAFIVFCTLSVVTIIVFATKKPLFQEWDEFSLWGTSARLTKEYNQIFSEVDFGWPWAATQKPGLMLLSYLFNFFGEFAPWRVFVAYDVLIFASVCAAVCTLSFKKWHIVVAGIVSGLLLPFILVYTRMIYFVPAYVSAYADVPMGIFMGAAIALYFHFVKTRNYDYLWCVGLVLGGVALCKDTGMPIALVAAGIIAIDLILCVKNCVFSLKFLKGAKAKIALLASYFIIPPACYLWCSKYVSSLGVSSSNLGGESEFTPVQLVTNGVKLLFGINNSEQTAQFAEKFSLVKANMIDAFINARITVFGSGLTVFIIIFILLALLCFLTRSSEMRHRAALYGIFSGLGFLAYYVFIGFTYVFIFKQSGVDLQDYNRYVGCMYSGILLGVFALYAIAAAEGTRYKDALTLGYIGFASAFLLWVGYLVPKHLSVINYPSTVYDDSFLLQKHADNIKKVTGDKSKIFYVNQEDNGEFWFKYSYALVPNVLVYSWGGGEIADPTVDKDVQICVSLNALCAYLAQENCEYMLIKKSNDNFINSYSKLMTDGGAAAKNGDALYKISIKPGYEIKSETPTNGERMQGGSDVSKSSEIKIMLNAEEYVSLSPVTTEAVYE